MVLDQQASELILLKAKLYDASEQLKAKDRFIKELADIFGVETYEDLHKKAKELNEKPAE
jgi:hypothetical protein